MKSLRERWSMRDGSTDVVEGRPPACHERGYKRSRSTASRGRSVSSPAIDAARGPPTTLRPGLKRRCAWAPNDATRGPYGRASLLLHMDVLYTNSLAPPVTRLVLPTTTLRSRRTPLAVRLTATAMVLRPRRILRVRGALRLRSSLGTRSSLRTRARLAAARAAAPELVRRRLGRTTGTRTLRLRRVVHLVGLINVGLNGAVGSAACATRMIVARHIYVRRLAVAAATGVGAGSGRPIVSASSVSDTGVSRAARPTAVEFRTVTRATARAATNLSTACRSRRPVASSGHMIWPTAAGSAMIGSVNIRPTSRSAMVITAVVGRTRSGSHYPST
jgi:hypothetical protein